MAILVSPLARALAIIAERRPSHVVSLLDPGSGFPCFEGGPHLQLSLHDIVEAEQGCVIPGKRHVQELLRFIEPWDRRDPILIHCYAGISRSSASAFITACAHNPGCDEEGIALAMRRASPGAHPNALIVALADAELGRGGRMVKAAKSIGPGRNWFSHGDNEPFEFASRF